MKISIRDYLDLHFSFNILALYLNRILAQVGFGVIGIFGAIFFYERLGSSILYLALTYSAIYLLNIIFTPMSARLIAQLGMRKMMMIAIPFAALSTLSLFLWDYAPAIFFPLSVLSSALYKTLYWIPYHVDFAKFSENKARGKQISVLLAVSEGFAVITPIVAGITITEFGYNILFIASTVILLLSIIPLFYIDNPKENYSYGYIETFKKLFSKESRGLLLGYIGDGAQSGITIVIWPIFIYLLLDKEYAAVGLVSSITILLVIVTRLLIGDILDQWNKSKVFLLSSIINSSGWIIKLFVETTSQIFLFDSYHKVGRAVNKLSIDTTTYTQAVDNGHYIDEFTALKEISVGIGHIIAFLIVGLAVSFVSLKVAFLVAAIASLFVTLLTRRTSLL